MRRARPHVSQAGLPLSSPFLQRTESPTPWVAVQLVAFTKEEGEQNIVFTFSLAEKQVYD